MCVICFDDPIFALNAWVLGKIYLKNLKSLCKLLFDLPKSYQSHIMSYLENLIHMLLVFALSLVKLLRPLEEFFSCFHDQDSYAHHTPLEMLLWEVSIVPSISFHKIKKLHNMCWSLSPSIITKETWGYQKKKYGHLRVQALKKRGWTHEGPRKKWRK
jgi:hypothetical protein